MWNNFLISLEIMGKGMAGIFVSILAIMAVVWILAKIGGPKEGQENC